MGGRTFSFSDQTLTDGESLATESKQDTANTSLSQIAADVKPLSGAGTAGTRELTLADTWYAVPSTVPASDYVLIVSKETASPGTMRWAFDDEEAPSETYGNKFSSQDIVVEMAANGVIYVASSQAEDDVNWTTKII